MVQVRTADGRQTLVLKLLCEDSVGSVYTYVDRARPDLSPYELRTAFPSRAYANRHVTLREAGLVPNATLVMRML